MTITSNFTNRSKKYDHNRNYKGKVFLGKQTAKAFERAFFIIGKALKLARSK